MNQNKLGGLIPDDLAKAKKVDLITLPKGVSGTNCSNCKYVDAEGEVPFCTHPKVQMNVNKRMCCALWDSEGVIRSWEKDLEVNSKYFAKKLKQVSVVPSTCFGKHFKPTGVKSETPSDPPPSEPPPSEPPPSDPPSSQEPPKAPKATFNAEGTIKEPAPDISEWSQDLERELQDKLGGMVSEEGTEDPRWGTSADNPEPLTPEQEEYIEGILLSYTPDVPLVSEEEHADQIRRELEGQEHEGVRRRQREDTPWYRRLFRRNRGNL